MLITQPCTIANGWKTLSVRGADLETDKPQQDENRLRRRAVAHFGFSFVPLVMSAPTESLELAIFENTLFDIELVCW